MHLLIATPHYPPESGGPATYAKILAENLPQLGVQVTIVRFEQVRRYPKILRPLLYCLLVLRAAPNVDAILTLDPVSTGLPAALTARLLGKPLIAKIVGDCAWERGHQLYGVTASLEEFATLKRLPLRVAAYRYTQKWVAAQTKRIIVPGTRLKEIVCSWGVAADKTTVIYNSVAIGPVAEVPAEVAAMQGFRVVTVARLIRLKHIDAIIAAVQQIPGAHLIVVGDGPERGSLQTMADGDKAIYFTGAVRNEEAFAIIRSAGALVLNSSWETFSHVLIEGLMAGVPIVATDTGGNPEILGQGGGLLVPVGDTSALAQAILTVKEDPDLRARMREAALARSKAFSLQTMLDRTKDVLTSVQSNA